MNDELIKNLLKIDPQTGDELELVSVIDIDNNGMQFFIMRNKKNGHDYKFELKITDLRNNRVCFTD